ncbi:MAG: aspartate-semialdehyde dehydrogenase [Clostridium sp.]|jgi:aspartate-semialdehyde dehydrogenase|nr:aspartate-semialdehyde dehydrogenase [Clostridium sp.]
MKKYNIAIVGATGLVGKKILEVLKERNFPMGNLIPMASERSAGELIEYAGKKYQVVKVSEEAFEQKIDMAFFAAGGEISEKFAPIASKRGIQVIDNSSVFRMDKDVPLIVPEVNPEDINKSKGIIANPNCSTIQCMLPIKAIQEIYGVKRIVYSTYQSVSGSGTKGLRDLDEGLSEFYPRPIKGNVIPHIDVFLDDGYTKEEQKMMDETRKILHDENLKVTATAVRVPVRFAHSISATIELEKDFKIRDIKEILNKFPGIILKDDPENAVYPIPEDAEGKDDVFVGRVRRDFSVDNGLHLWIVADNIRKGAATNSVQIGELLVKSWEKNI